MGFSGGSDSKESACNAGHLGSIPGPGRSPGEGNRSSLQCSCLENPMDRGAWWATVLGVAESDIIKRLTHTHNIYNAKRWLMFLNEGFLCARNLYALHLIVIITLWKRSSLTIPYMGGEILGPKKLKTCQSSQSSLATEWGLELRSVSPQSCVSLIRTLVAGCGSREQTSMNTSEDGLESVITT